MDNIASDCYVIRFRHNWNIYNGTPVLPWEPQNVCQHLHSCSKGGDKALFRPSTTELDCQTIYSIIWHLIFSLTPHPTDCNPINLLLWDAEERVSTKSSCNMMDKLWSSITKPVWRSVKDTDGGPYPVPLSPSGQIQVDCLRSVKHELKTNRPILKYSLKIIT